MLRRIIQSQHFKPGLTFLVITAVFIAFWINSRHHERQLLSLETRITSEQIAIRLQNYITTRISLVQSLGKEWMTGHIPSQEIFTDHAHEIMSNFDGFQAINWIDAQGNIRWIVPEEGNEPARNASLREHPVVGPLLELVDRNGKNIATPPIDLLQGGRGIASYFPLLVNGQSEGYLNGVFRLEPMMMASLGSDVTANFNYIVHDEGQEVIRFDNDEEIIDKGVSTPFAVRFLNRTWQVALYPRRHVLDAHSSFTDEGILVIGILLALGLAWELRRLDSHQRAIRARTDELQAIYKAYPDLQFRIDARGVILDYQTSQESRLYLPEKDFLGRRMQDVLPDSIGMQFSDAFVSVVKNRAAVRIEYSIPIKGKMEVFEARIVPLRDSEMIVIAREITDRKNAERRQKLMMAELDHRVKNTLASILALHEQTQMSSGTMEEYSHRFKARLLAMARMHETLAENNWDGVRLRQLITDTLKVYLGDNESRISLKGRDVMLQSEITSAMCLAVHELTTNAVKYGSLSVPTGRIDVEWELIDEDRTLQLQWRESGGPIVQKPNPEGMGFSLIRGLIGSQLGGKVDLSIEASGLVATMSIPLDRYDSSNSWDLDAEGNE